MLLRMVGSIMVTMMLDNFIGIIKMRMQRACNKYNKWFLHTQNSLKGFCCKQIHLSKEKIAHLVQRATRDWKKSL